MNQEHQYRPDNHYTFPRTPFEVMDDHMALYPEGKEFRWSIIGLRNLYMETPFLSLMQEYARFMRLAKVGSIDDMPQRFSNSDHDTFFLGGSVMAMHTMLYGASKVTCQKVLAVNPLQDLRAMPDCEEKAAVIEQTIQSMTEWEAVGAEASYEAQTDEFKEKLLELSIYVCNDLEKPEGKDTMFVSGFMFASELIWRFSKRNIPRV